MIRSEFIGRRRELEKLKAALDTLSEDRPHIVFIYDAAENPEEKGGIGKTRLLNEFIQIAKSPEYENNFIIIDEIFDFYEPVNRDSLSRISRLVRFLEAKTPTKAFDKFWKIEREYYLKNVTLEKVLQEYFSCYNQLCQETGKKIIHFYDTFEVTEKNLNYFQAPYRFIDDQILTNSFVVISGRNQPDLTAPIWEGRESQILALPLKGFSDEEAQRYFISAGYEDLQSQYIIDLNQKAKRRPILLALIVDYLKNILNVEDILQLNEKDFKERLVAFINDFHNPPIDQAILAMAHLKHQCNAKFLGQFVEPNENFDKDYVTLKSLSFVRQLGTKGDYVVLHDEMQKMMSDYILDKLYSDGSLRREISEKAIDFYEEEIKELRKKEDEYTKNNELSNLQVVRDEIFILIAEKRYHELYVNKAENIEIYFFEFYDPTFEAGQLDSCFNLLGHLQDLDKLLNLKIENKNRIKMREARLNMERFLFTGNQYYYGEANEKIDELIDDAKKRGPKTYLGTVLCDYGTLQFYSGKLLDAEKILRESVQELEKETEKIDHNLFYYRGKTQNWLGYILYNQGRFRESIKVFEEAEKYLSKAAKLVRDDPKETTEFKDLRLKQIDSWLAQVRGNLCRVYREVGDLGGAIFHGESSLSRRRKLGNLKEIVKGLNSLGLAYERNGEDLLAQKLYEEAEGHLPNVPDPILEATIRTNKTTLLFKRDRFSDLLLENTRRTLSFAKKALKVDQPSTDEAKRLLNNVIDSLIRTNSRQLAITYNNLGEVDLLEEKYDEAIENFKKSIGISQNRNDTYILLNSRQRLVLAAYLKNDPDQFLKYAKEFSSTQKELKELEETARYVIRYYITFGNFYYDKLFDDEKIKNFDENFRAAFRSYTDAIVYARKYAEGTLKVVQEVFTRRLLELLKETKEFPQPLQKELLTEWQKRQLKTDELERYFDF